MRGRVDGMLTKLWLDTGADVSLIREDMRLLLARDAHLHKQELLLPDGKKTLTKGYMDVTVHVAGAKAQVRLLIVHGLGIPALLGTDALSKLGIDISFPKQRVFTKKGNVPFWPLLLKDKEQHRDKMSTISILTVCERQRDHLLVDDIQVEEYPKEVLIDENYFTPGKAENIHNKPSLNYLCNFSVFSKTDDRDIINFRREGGPW